MHKIQGKTYILMISKKTNSRVFAPIIIKYHDTNQIERIPITMDAQQRSLGLLMFWHNFNNLQFLIPRFEGQ
jgi:hypothetical protein